MRRSVGLLAVLTALASAAPGGASPGRHELRATATDTGNRTFSAVRDLRVCR